METTATTPSKTTSKHTGLILFALVIVAAVLIVVTAVGDVTAVRVNAGTAQANATQVARCGMDEQTFVQMPPSLQVDLAAQCDSPVELQP